MPTSLIPALILYVEDEFLVQELLQAALLDAGFAVMVASNGAEALDRIRYCSCELSGLITDVDLGKGLKGWDIARHARTVLPQLPIVYVSGASEHEWGREGVFSSLMIAKPFTTTHVVTAISSLIGARAVDAEDPSRPRTPRGLQA